MKRVKGNRDNALRPRTRTLQGAGRHKGESQECLRAAKATCTTRFSFDPNLITLVSSVVGCALVAAGVL